MKSMVASLYPRPQLVDFTAMLVKYAAGLGRALVLRGLFRLNGGRLRLHRLALCQQGREIEVTIRHQLIAAGGKARLLCRIMGGRGRDRLAIDRAVAAAHDGDD